MKIISYNTYKCTKAKIEHILALGADLYILPECFSQEHISLPEGYYMLWCGDDDLKEKGLGVIWKNHLNVQMIPEYRKIKHMLPIIVDGAGLPKFILASCLLSGRKRRPTHSCYLKRSKSILSTSIDTRQWWLVTSTAISVKAE